MTSLLTRTIIAVLKDHRHTCRLTHERESLPAQRITGLVRERIPTARHNVVTAELYRLVEKGQLRELREPRLPTRFALPKRQP